MSVTTSRQRVLAYLQKQKTATAAEISRALGMTAANARHHLAILEKSGVVAAFSEGKEKRRGRPAQRYTLARFARGEGVIPLASHLLEEYIGSVPPDKREARLRRLARRFAGAPAKGGIMQRLLETVRRLNQLGYDARWEAHAEGPRILLRQCPYAAILPEHPEICEMDAALLEYLLGGEAAPLLTRSAQENAAACIFLIRPE